MSELKCRFSVCEKDVFQMGVCAAHWAWLNGIQRAVQDTMRETVEVARTQNTPDSQKESG